MKYVNEFWNGKKNNNRHEVKWRRNRSFTASKSISMQCTHYGAERVRNACVLLDHIINRNFLFFQPRNHQYSSTFSRFSFLSICVMLCAFIIYCNSRIKLESAVIMMHRVCTDSLKQRTTWMHSTAMGYHRMAKNLKKKKYSAQIRLRGGGPFECIESTWAWPRIWHMPLCSIEPR